MKVVESKNAKAFPADQDLARALSLVARGELVRLVGELAVPRHFRHNAANNRAVREFIFRELAAAGYETAFQGPYENVVARGRGVGAGSRVVLVGAHFDSVPDCPGADDNASAVAALLVAARAVAAAAPAIPVVFAAFNCEEDGLVGSANFVADFLPRCGFEIAEVHVLEMIGYATGEENSQAAPKGLPIGLPTTGDFLGLLGNHASAGFVDALVGAGKSCLPELSVVGLKIHLGLEKLVPDLARSDHYPFWERGIPAVMWTDTANFRNPNYHRYTDTPDTLNYDFLLRATQLLTLRLLSHRIK